MPEINGLQIEEIPKEQWSVNQPQAPVVPGMPPAGQPQPAQAPPTPFSMKTARTVSPNDPNLVKLPVAPGYQNVRAALPLMVPGGPLTQIPAQAALEGGLRLAEGKGTKEALKGAGLAGAGAGLGALGGKAIEQGSRFLTGGKAKAGFEAATAGYEQALKSRESKIAFDKAMTTAVSGAEKQRAGEDVAEGLVRFAKSKIPESVTKGIREGSGGIEDLVSARVYHRMNRMYDDYMKDVVKTGKGQIIQLSEYTAKSLGVKVGKEGMALIDAGKAAEKAVGLWRKDPAAYRDIQRVLDQARIGDPATRAAYKTYMALSDLVTKNKLLAKGTFDLEKAQRVLRDVGAQPLKKRGDIGEDVEAIVKGGKVPGLRLPPAPPGMPTEPAKPPAFRIEHPFALGGAAGELAAMATGQHGWLPFLAGGAAGSALLPKELTLGDPTGLASLLYQLLPRAGAAAGPQAEKLVP